jgi:S-DNA-T family DNA segregation ATPase FtsK/SpoIIIE
MRNSPEETKLIMIDPKMVELGIYADIPHLLTPVVTDPLKAANALKWAVDEMERRYRLLAENAFRNLDHYNDAARKQNPEETPPEERLEVLPYIVVVIDEMADLMMVARGEVEESIARLAQKSRAIGIHLILATQRPSVDIITGVIKSNLPSRLAYRVAQRNDSRIILDGNGAEQLLGKGDALFLGPGTSRLVRVHAPFLSETEVLSLVKSLKNQGAPSYNEEVVKKYEPAADDVESDMSDSKGKGKKAKKKASTDEMYEKAARLVVRSGQASVSYLQRKLGLGYARAAKLVDLMEDDGIVGPSQGSKARDILVSADFFDEIDNARME